jgi:hypothetical protein
VTVFSSVGSVQRDYISSNDNSLDYKGNGSGKAVLLIINSILSARNDTYNFIFRLDGEDKQISALNTDTASAGSYKFYEFKPEFALTDFSHGFFLQV